MAHKTLLNNTNSMLLIDFAQFLLAFSPFN